MQRRDLETDLIALLPPRYRAIGDFEQMVNAEAPQFDQLVTDALQVSENFFSQTMDAGALTLWEQLFGIVSSPTETIEFRRDRLLSRLSSRPPYTLGFLYQKLDELIGAGQWEVYVLYDQYTVIIESAANNQSYAQEVQFTIDQIKPAHMVFVTSPLITATMLFAEQIETTEQTNNYRLGAWGLGQKPFVSLGEMEVQKPMSLPSIQPLLLEGAAQFVIGDVASARINGTLTITDLDKTVEGAQAVISYTVPETFQSNITQVELLNAGGDPLTVSAVYVPVVSSVLVRHRIPIKEGI